MTSAAWLVSGSSRTSTRCKTGALKPGGTLMVTLTVSKFPVAGRTGRATLAVTPQVAPISVRVTLFDNVCPRKTYSADRVTVLPLHSGPAVVGTQKTFWFGAGC